MRLVDPRHRLSARFMLAGAMFVAATIACGVWSAYTFARLSRVVDESLRDSQHALDRSALLASHLEREDDALLLIIAERGPRARQALSAQRPQFDREYQQLMGVLGEAGERQAADRLAEHVRLYRKEVDALLDVADPTTALVRYHQRVNPILRDAVAAAGAIRELNFRAMELAGVRARDEASRATRVVIIVLVAALAMSLFTALWLARAVIGPVTAITTSVDALGRGEFGRRVTVANRDEIGRLAEGFNRMAEALEDFRRSNLGEVLRSKALLETTLEALPDAVIVTDARATTIESMNRRARRMLLGDEGAAVPALLAQLPVSIAIRDAVTQAVTGAGRSPPRTDLADAFVIAVDGAEHSILAMAAPVPHLGDDRPGTIVVLHDVTDFVRLDELRSEVVAVASHELKTPLTTIRMNLLLLQESARDVAGARREMLDTALMGCEELAAIIDRLLDVARIEAGQLRLVRERVDLRALVEQVIARARARATEAQIDARVPSVPVVADVDAGRMGIVLSNLVGNALKYSPADSPISVAMEAHGATVELVVTDRGPGVPAGLEERVFEKFFRVEHQHPERDRGTKGAGLGLYLSRQIVAAHGGRISLERGPEGIGARVTISLPRVPAR